MNTLQTSTRKASSAGDRVGGNPDTVYLSNSLPRLSQEAARVEADGHLNTPPSTSLADPRDNPSGCIAERRRERGFATSAFARGALGARVTIPEPLLGQFATELIVRR
jgi:hypothetical protein